MTKLFIIYILSIFVIIIALIFRMIRNKHIYDYRDKYFNKTDKIRFIPRNIFQLIQNKNNISPEFQKNIKFLKEKNPTWKYTLYDDEDMVNYIEKYYGSEILYYYNKINPKYGASRADFFRYLLMYREGGVYLDIKSAVVQPLNKIILPDDEYLLSYWDLPTQSDLIGNNFGEFQQWHIICRPKHPYLYKVINDVIYNIENYRKEKDGVGKDAVLKITGPISYTKSILPILNMYGHRLIYLNEYVGLVYNNIKKSHINLFSKTHYSKITESVIIND
jgi:mannosyltransferase OCH1-like enzyme